LVGSELEIDVKTGEDRSLLAMVVGVVLDGGLIRGRRLLGQKRSTISSHTDGSPGNLYKKISSQSSLPNPVLLNLLGFKSRSKTNFQVTVPVKM